tara:strand:+ start:544 stop:711 length:168 start_codon:yes stop_codon:yes gene_type:complete
MAVHGGRKIPPTLVASVDYGRHRSVEKVVGERSNNFTHLDSFIPWQVIQEVLNTF